MVAPIWCGGGEHAADSAAVRDKAKVNGAAQVRVGGVEGNLGGGEHPAGLHQFSVQGGSMNEKLDRLRQKKLFLFDIDGTIAVGDTLYKGTAGPPPLLR